jgi:hypothetical protein
MSLGRDESSPATPSTLFPVPPERHARNRRSPRDGSRWSLTSPTRNGRTKDGVPGAHYPHLLSGPADRSRVASPSRAHGRPASRLELPFMPSSRPTALDFQTYLFPRRPRSPDARGDGPVQVSGHLKRCGRRHRVGSVDQWGRPFVADGDSLAADKLTQLLRGQAVPGEPARQAGPESVRQANVGVWP